MKLKPVILVQGRYAYNRQNTTQQMMVLKALTLTQDPKKIRDIVGFRDVAEVYRTLDKIQMRKSYHEALAKAGLTFDFITKTMKDVIDNATKDSDKLVGVKIFLKSIGLDKYEETAIGGGSWEEVLLKISKDASEGNKPSTMVKYEVVEPKMPEHIRIAKEKANTESRGLYD